MTWNQYQQKHPLTKFGYTASDVDKWRYNAYLAGKRDGGAGIALVVVLTVLFCAVGGAF